MGISLVAPEGLKTGEVWPTIETGGQMAWVVTDAFSGPKGLVGTYASQPEMLGPFPKFGVADSEVYIDWL